MFVPKEALQVIRERLMTKLQLLQVVGVNKSRPQNLGDSLKVLTVCASTALGMSIAGIVIPAMNSDVNPTSQSSM